MRFTTAILKVATIYGYVQVHTLPPRVKALRTMEELGTGIKYKKNTKFWRSKLGLEIKRNGI